MTVPTKGCNVYPTVIAIPSALSDDFDIATAGDAGEDITTLKSTLLVVSGAIHFDVRNDGDYVMHGEGAVIEAVEGKKYNQNTSEQLVKIVIPFEPNNDEGATGEAARDVIAAARHEPYDLYCFDNTNRTNSPVAKMVGVVLDITKPKMTPFDKFMQEASGQTKAEADYTYNVLETLYVVP